jgi:hypothetical protein
MMLGITKGELRIDLDLRERIIIHLASAPKPPKTEYDTNGIPRTIAYMMRMVGMTRASVTYALDMLEAEGLVMVSGLLNTREGYARYGGHGANVYALTADGELLAEAIRRRAI